MNKNLKRYVRGMRFLFTYLFIEKPRGIDFSLRQKTVGITESGNHGYALTQRKSFDGIMKKLEIGEGDSFIDIGCGKGGVLRYAAEYDFRRVAGLEIEKSLYKTAVRNFEKLNMPGIELFHDNALTFSHYREFNIFFFFNPFDTSTYQQVVDKIAEDIKESERRVYLICYGASIPEYIQSKKVFLKVEDYVDKIRGTPVVVWKLK